MLLKSQPDIGMLAVITVVFLAQLYINGLPLVLVGMAMGLMGGGAVMAYTFFPHVRVAVRRLLEGRRATTIRSTRRWRPLAMVG